MLQKSSHIALPCFPYKYRPLVDQQIKSILSQLSSVFPSGTFASTSISPNAHIDRHRERLSILNESTRGQLLQVMVLDRAVREVKGVYDTLKDEQRQLMDQINHIVMRKGRMPMLPIEVIEIICSFSCDRVTPAALRAWGPILYKCVPFHCTFEDLGSDKTQLAINNGMRLNVCDIRHHIDTENRLRRLTYSEKESFGVWKTAHLSVQPYSNIPKLTKILLGCRSFLFDSVKHLEVTLCSRTEPSTKELRDEYELADGFHHLRLPLCTSLRIPLTLVPWFRSVIPAVPHLEVDFYYSSARSGFVSSFEGINLDELRSLDICNHFLSTTSDSDPVDGNSLSLPNLRRLMITANGNFNTTQEQFFAFQAILKGVECEQLRWFEIRPCFRMPSCSISMLLETIGTCFKYLQRLSVHKLNSVELTLAILDELQKRTLEEKLPLPNLKHLSISFHPSPNHFKEEINALVKLLEHRRKDGACIDTIELHLPSLAPPSDDWRHFPMEYLGVLTREVFLIPDLESFYHMT